MSTEEEDERSREEKGKVFGEIYDILSTALPDKVYKIGDVMHVLSFMIYSETARYRTFEDYREFLNSVWSFRKKWKLKDKEAQLKEEETNDK